MIEVVPRVEGLSTAVPTHVVYCVIALSPGVLFGPLLYRQWSHNLVAQMVVNCLGC